MDYNLNNLLLEVNYLDSIINYIRTVAVSFAMLRLVVRSLSGKNWQDLYKADKVSISFPATPKSN